MKYSFKQHFSMLSIIIALTTIAGCSRSIFHTASDAYVISGEGVTQFTSGKDGLLTRVPKPSVRAGWLAPQYIGTVKGKYVYASSPEGLVQFSIDTDGGLFNPVERLKGYGRFYFDPQGNFVYANAGHGLEQFSVGTDGSLTRTGNPALPIQYIYFESQGKHAYLTDGYKLARVVVGKDGVFSDVKEVKLGIYDSDYMISTKVVFDPKDKYAYVIFHDHGVAQFRVGESGDLLDGHFITQDRGVVSIVFDPKGKYAYTLIGDSTQAGQSNTITQYSVGDDGGLFPTSVPAIKTGVNLTGIAFS